MVDGSAGTNRGDDVGRQKHLKRSRDLADFLAKDL